MGNGAGLFWDNPTGDGYECGGIEGDVGCLAIVEDMHVEKDGFSDLVRSGGRSGAGEVENVFKRSLVTDVRGEGAGGGLRLYVIHGWWWWCCVVFVLR